MTPVKPPFRLGGSLAYTKTANYENSTSMDQLRVNQATARTRLSTQLSSNTQKNRQSEREKSLSKTTNAPSTIAADNTSTEILDPRQKLLKKLRDKLQSKRSSTAVMTTSI